MDTGPGKRGGRGARAAAAAMVVAVSFAPVLLAEFALRISDFRSAEDWYFEDMEGHEPVFVREGDRWVVAEAKRRSFRAGSFPDAKPPGSIRVFVAGDSIAWGHQSNAAGPLRAFADVLEDLLRSRPGGSEADRVLNCAARTWASGRVLGVVREALAHSPDVVVASFGSSEFLEASTRAAWRARVERIPSWVRALRLAAFVADRMPGGGLRSDVGLSNEALRGRDAALRSGFVDPGAVPDDAGRAAVVDQAARNVAAMVDACREAGVPLVLLTVPSNLRFPPFASRYRDPAAGEARVVRAGGLLEAGKAADAAAVAGEGVAADPGAAALRYRLATALDGIGDAEGAAREYLAAKDADGFPLRALSDFNRIVREAPSRWDGVRVLDVERLVASLAPDGVPDDRLFLDHCHPREEVHRRIAEALAGVVQSAAEARRR